MKSQIVDPAWLKDLGATFGLGLMVLMEGGVGAHEGVGVGVSRCKVLGTGAMLEAVLNLCLYLRKSLGIERKRDKIQDSA